MNIDPPGVPVARHMVWQPVRRQRIESLTRRRLFAGSVASHPCLASRRRVSMATWSTGVVAPEAFSSVCSSARRSGLVST
jgi:hypothetical protein